VPYSIEDVKLLNRNHINLTGTRCGHISVISAEYHVL